VAFDRPHAKEFGDLLGDLPATCGKAAEWRGTPAAIVPRSSRACGKKKSASSGLAAIRQEEGIRVFDLNGCDGQQQAPQCRQAGVGP
jgi:hypothetical protein